MNRPKAVLGKRPDTPVWQRQGFASKEAMEADRNRKALLGGLPHTFRREHGHARWLRLDGWPPEGIYFGKSTALELGSAELFFREHRENVLGHGLDFGVGFWFLGTIWKYPKPLVDHAAALAGVSERTVRRWCLAGLNLGDDADVLRFKRYAGHPPGRSSSRRGKDCVDAADLRFNRWLRGWLVAGKTKPK